MMIYTFKESFGARGLGRAGGGETAMASDAAPTAVVIQPGLLKIQTVVVRGAHRALDRTTHLTLGNPG